MILHIDNSDAISSVRSCNIRFQNFEIVHKNIFPTSKIGQLAEPVKGVILGTDFQVFHQTFYFLLYLYQPESSRERDCMIRFENVLFEDVVLLKEPLQE